MNALEKRMLWHIAFTLAIRIPVESQKLYFIILSLISYRGIFMTRHFCKGEFEVSPDFVYEIALNSVDPKKIDVGKLYEAFRVYRALKNIT